jgi:hypothetical protein
MKRNELFLPKTMVLRVEIITSENRLNTRLESCQIGKFYAEKLPIWQA